MKNGKAAMENSMVIPQRNRNAALPRVAQWIERQPANQRVTGLIPGQGTCLGCRPGPWGVCERQPHSDVSLPLPPSLPPHSKNK